MRPADPMQTNSPAKMKCIDFIKSTDNAEFVFDIEGGEEAAHKFIQHMRVELSRMRAILRSAGKQPRRFRLQKRGVEVLPNGTTRITLFKDSSAERITQDLSAVFPELVSPINTTD